MADYKQARADHEYLWGTYGAAYDMTGGYVDQKDLDSLLENPTRANARDCYVSQIRYWFQVGPDPNDCGPEWQDDPRVEEIAERYGCEVDTAWLRRRG